MAVDGFRRGILAAATLAFWGTAAAAADGERDSFRWGNVRILGDEPSYLDFAAGGFDVLGEGKGNASAAGRIEFRWGHKLFFIGPAIGLMANTDGGVFGYAGIYSDIKYQNFVVTPLAAVGGYRQGDSKDLGGIFQFRIGFAVAYQFENGARLGLRVDHISNASIHKDNPGEDEILLTYAIPLTKLF